MKKLHILLFLLDGRSTTMMLLLNSALKEETCLL